MHPVRVHIARSSRCGALVGCRLTSPERKDFRELQEAIHESLTTIPLAKIVAPKLHSSFAPKPPRDSKPLYWVCKQTKQPST